jgi:hypothetical protein
VRSRNLASTLLTLEQQKTVREHHVLSKVCGMVGVLQGLCERCKGILRGGEPLTVQISSYNVLHLELTYLHNISSASNSSVRLLLEESAKELHLEGLWEEIQILEQKIFGKS